MGVLVLLWLALKLAAASLLGVLLYLFFNPVNRLKYWNIPGPAYRPLFGNLPEFRQHGGHEYMAALKRQYGPVFKMWFGHRVWVIVADPELGKRVNYKLINRPREFGDPLIPRGPMSQPENKGLFFSRGDVWRTLHKVWQPAFYAESVHACAPLMSAATQRMVERLEALAAAGQPVDMWRQVGKLTMAVVGSAAYGINFHTIDAPEGAGEPAAPGGATRAARDAALVADLPASTKASLAGASVDLGQQDVGARLVASAQTLFTAAAAASGSVYQQLALLSPSLLRPLITAAAHAFPDASFRRVIDARATLSCASMQLVAQKRKQLQQQQPASPAAAPAAAAPAAGFRRAGGATAPGGFLDLLLSARSGADGAPLLTDLQLLLQANTFTLAGYETTANTLSFALFCLASHPAAEARVLEELRAAGAGGGRPATLDSRQLEKQFPFTCAVISEALRLYPPGASTTREVGEEPLQLGQYVLPPGTAVFVASYVMQRDPELWERPLEFLPERWLPGHEHLAPRHPAAYLPFGSGGRMCIGSKFALQEVRLALLELVQKLHFDVAWHLMVPADGAGSAGGAGGSAGKEQPRGAVRGLKTKLGFTLSPAGGIWMYVTRRGDYAADC